MSKITEPSERFTKDFITFLKRSYKGREFSMAEAANRFFQKRYNTEDKWTDAKNITGFVNKKSELGEMFEFTESKPSELTGKISKHYKLI